MTCFCACSWYKWWQIQFWFLFLGQQLGVGSWTQFTWLCFFVLGTFIGSCSCSSLCLPRVSHPCRCKFQAWWTTLWKNAAFGSVPWFGTGKLKIKSNKKEIKFDSINTFQSPCLAINLPLSGDPMPSAASGIPLKRIWGIYWGVPWRVMGEGRSLPVQLDEHWFLGAVLCSAVSLVDAALSQPWPPQNLWAPLALGFLKPLWDKQSAVEVDSWQADVGFGNRAPHFTWHVQGSCVPVSFTENCQGNLC